MKTPLFMDRVLIFPFPSTKTAISMDNKKPSAKLEFKCKSRGMETCLHFRGAALNASETGI